MLCASVNGRPSLNSLARGGVMRPSLDQLASAAVIVAALAVVTGTIRREMRASSFTTGVASNEPVLLEDWRSLLDIGIRQGDPLAPVSIIEFGDLECQFCARMNKYILATLDSLDRQVEYTFIHFPLEQHRYARTAARALECGTAQGAFIPVKSALYERQDAFGTHPWQEVALAAGVPEVERFVSCTLDTVAFPRIGLGLEAAERLAIEGTPTLIINGWKYPALHPDSVYPEVLRRLNQALTNRR